MNNIIRTALIQEWKLAGVVAKPVDNMAMYKKDQEKVIPTGRKQQQVPEKKETGD